MTTEFTQLATPVRTHAEFRSDGTYIVGQLFGYTVEHGPIAEKLRTHKQGMREHLAVAKDVWFAMGEGWIPQPHDIIYIMPAPIDVDSLGGYLISR